MSGDDTKYDSMWQSYLDRTHREVIQTLEETLRDTKDIKLLDISAGSGKIYEKLSESDLDFSRIVFNDPDADAMSEERKENIQSMFDCEVSFDDYYVKNLGYTNRSFDVVLSVSAYHLYELKYNFFEEADRVLTHQGHLLILDWYNKGWFAPIHWFISRWVEEEINSESPSEIIQRANKRWFSTQHSSTWSWRWWRFFTVVLQKYDDDFLGSSTASQEKALGDTDNRKNT